MTIVIVICRAIRLRKNRILFKKGALWPKETFFIVFPNSVLYLIYKPPLILRVNILFFFINLTKKPPPGIQK